MKAPVAVFLILCGTLLILAPLLHNIVLAGMITVTMVKGGHASIRADLPHFEALVAACVIAGVVMILCGVVGGFRGLGSRSAKD